MGEKYPGKYPPNMRFVSLLNMIILSCITIIVLVKADIIFFQAKPLSAVTICFFLVFSAITTILIIIIPSKIERQIWIPVTTIKLNANVIVALN